MSDRFLDEVMAGRSPERLREAEQVLRDAEPLLELLDALWDVCTSTHSTRAFRVQALREVRAVLATLDGAASSAAVLIEAGDAVAGSKGGSR